MTSYAHTRILMQKLLEEKRTIDGSAGRLLMNKISYAGDDHLIQQFMNDAANAAATASARITTLLEHLDARLR